MNMKDKIKYLIHKLFIYKKVDIKNPLVLSCLTEILLKYYPDFNKDELVKVMQSTYNTNYTIQDVDLDLTGFNNPLISCEDYNELYLAIKKSLIYSDSFEP